MTAKDSRPGSAKDRRPRNPQPKQHDPYTKGAKSSDAIVCDDCGLVHHAGRWYRGAPPLGDVHDGVCPACKRIRDDYPAGTIRIPAVFLENRAEVESMVRNAEEAEAGEHPLERVMAMKDGDDGELVVTTTGIHLARRITGKLARRFHRKAVIRYPEEEHRMDVWWE